MFQPYDSFFGHHDEREARRKNEKLRLQRDAAYIGALSLALTLVMQYAFSFVVILLVKCGFLAADDIGRPFLGMSNTTYMAFYMTMYTLSLLIPAVIVSFCFKKRFMPFSPAKSVPFGVAFLAIPAAIGLCMLANVINAYIRYFFTQIGWVVTDAPQTMVETPTSLALNLFTIALLPALLEEMIYRGYILRTLRPYGNLFAVLISSLLFSLMHGNLRQIPFAFMVGVVLGLLYVCTNNIWLSIAVHFANNSISVLMEYFAFSIPREHQGMFNATVIYGLIAVGMLCLLILVIVYFKHLCLKRVRTSLSWISRLGAVFTTPLFLSAILMYILLLVLES